MKVAIKTKFSVYIPVWSTNGWRKKRIWYLASRESWISEIRKKD